jgi:hypothetical protein
LHIAVLSRSFYFASNQIVNDLRMETSDPGEESQSHAGLETFLRTTYPLCAKAVLDAAAHVLYYVRSKLSERPTFQDKQATSRKLGKT